jgi:hypothetical protein
MYFYKKQNLDLCNKNQLDALFVLSSFRHSTSTRLGHICSTSSGGILCIYNSYVLYICSILPDDGLKICPKHVKVDGRNKMRINSASNWFLSHTCVEMQGQQNMEFRFVWTDDVIFVVVTTQRDDIRYNMRTASTGKHSSNHHPETTDENFLPKR